MKPTNTDILIIGAGPTGTIAAATAIQQGLRVHIVEKAHFPRFVIGESLLPKCMEHFEETGLLDVISKQNYQKKRGVRILRDDKSCWFDFSDQYSEGWSWTWQVPRAHFDKVLADEVKRRGVTIDFGSLVTDVEMTGSESTTTVKDDDGGERRIRARYIIDASGYGRVLPGIFGLNKEPTSPPRLAIFSHFTDEMRPDEVLGDQIQIIIHRRDVWVWVIPFSDGRVSVGFVGNPEYIDAYTQDDIDMQLMDLIEQVPQLYERLHGQKAIHPATRINAYAVSTTQTYGPGFVIAGNSSEFIDPLFSSGVTFATESGTLAAKLVCRELSGQTVNWQREYHDHMQQGIDTFRSYVDEWYGGTLQEIFFYTDDNVNQKIKQQICSVLAGQVWDKKNPFVGPKRERALNTIAKLIGV